jgi:glycosyltransferase involved in cell wall biosynthesis
MNLLYLDIHPVPDIQPESLQILQTCDGLAAQGIKVTLVTPQAHQDAETILGRPVAAGLALQGLVAPWLSHHLFPRSSRWFYRACCREIQRSKADVILVRNLKLAEALLASGMDIPLVFETHEVFATTYAEAHPHPSARQQRKLRQLKQREQRVYEKSSGLIVLTGLLRDDIRINYSTHVPIWVAPDGVDFFLADDARRSRPANVPSIALYLGSLHPWKGVETAIRALPLVANMVLHIAGGTESRIAELEALAASLGVDHRVNLLGPVFPGERFRLINDVDVCLLPLAQTSIGARYTSPLKLFEYMAMGKAIVASDLPSLREVLQPEVNALLTPPGDSLALAKALTRLSEDAELTEALGKQALVDSRRYGWQNRAKGIAGFLEMLLKRHVPL